MKLERGWLWTTLKEHQRKGKVKKQNKHKTIVFGGWVVSAQNNCCCCCCCITNVIMARSYITIGWIEKLYHDWLDEMNWLLFAGRVGRTHMHEALFEIHPTSHFPFWYFNSATLPSSPNPSWLFLGNTYELMTSLMWIGPIGGKDLLLSKIQEHYFWSEISSEI